MSKPRRHRRAGRATPQGTRPRSYQGDHLHRAAGRPEPEPDLMHDIRRAVASTHPLDLLALASSLLALVDPRPRSPLVPLHTSEPGTPTRDQLLATFIEVNRPETSALLAALGAMVDDDITQTRIRRALSRRHDTLPRWLAEVHDVVAYRAVEMVHVLGDGDNVIVGARLPGGHELSIVVYIDHNLGTVVKDAFVVPDSIAELVAFMRSKTDDPDTRWNDIDAAEARARITDAIATGAQTFPPFESDTWPVCRPLVEWIAAQLPPGGRGYERPEWGGAARQRLAEQFFASPFAAGVRQRDHRDLLDALLWFGADYGPGDPLRWSPVAVEILLDDWLPRKVVADVRTLAKAPTLLGAFVRFAHAARGIRPALTAETLSAIDRWAPDYQRTIRATRSPRPDIWQGLLRDAVGGEDALAHLDDAPLPDEPFAWDGIDGDIRARVGEVVARCDRCCDELLDPEYRTACRRFVALLAQRGPEVFRRRGRTDTAAAAVCWIIAKANHRFRASAGGLRAKDLLAHFGLQQGSVSQRAATLLRATGIDTCGDINLGSPNLLVSARRRAILERRDRSRGSTSGEPSS